jgi:hypothetical protein
VATATGQGTVRFRIDDLEPGEQRTVTIEFPTNFAATANGATATGDGGTQANPQNLLDGTEATNWSATGADVAGRYVTIALGQRRAIDGANVSAMLVPGNNRFVALRQFQLFACDATRERRNPTGDPAVDAGWKLFLASGPNVFPTTNPRPIVTT